MPRIEKALEPFSPRPHWGKLFTIPSSALAKAYPKFAAFKEFAQMHDPEGKFRNEFLDQVIWGSLFNGHNIKPGKKCKGAKPAFPKTLTLVFPFLISLTKCPKTLYPPYFISKGSTPYRKLFPFWTKEKLITAGCGC